ncbi:hypothetical protein B0H67DRAFT_581010 [Lasiosphaeris hirsuta]|uniref:Uncharacterized protein n=1 Tax=Lasiosphaeris hirsuta TaxID=260670 RepID=A0AA40AGU1_9PEZI|nr:hypothetical protein B0H67DRAFT_581010 [Lasiosphaeris hirsuta]
MNSALPFKTHAATMYSTAHGNSDSVSRPHPMPQLIFPSSPSQHRIEITLSQHPDHSRPQLTLVPASPSTPRSLKGGVIFETSWVE